MEVVYLRNWVGECEGITVRADCANKRRIYKLGIGGLRKWAVWVGGDYGARRLRK
jgi:hypothetical protein